MLTQNEFIEYVKYMLKMGCGFHTTTGFAEAQWFYAAANSELFLEFVTLLSLIDSGFDKYSSLCDYTAYDNSNENWTFYNSAYVFFMVAIWLQSICIYSLLVENRLVLHHCRKPFTI